MNAPFKLGELGQKYKTADFAQANALLDAAEQAWPYRIKTNRAKRIAFGLPPDRPMTE